MNGASDSVTVDLLTYEDLELLRAQKHGMQAPSAGQHHNIPDKLSSRRYMIMTFSSEFDRVHYPLPLDYNGPPDVRLLQQTIR